MTTTKSVLTLSLIILMLSLVTGITTVQAKSNNQYNDQNNSDRNRSDRNRSDRNRNDRNRSDRNYSKPHYYNHGNSHSWSDKQRRQNYYDNRWYYEKRDNRRRYENRDYKYYPSTPPTVLIQPPLFSFPFGGN